MRHYCLLFLIAWSSILMISLAGCRKPIEIPEDTSVMDNLDELGLPPATTTGENTFGCLINGESWLPLKRNLLGDLRYSLDFSYGSVEPGYFTCLVDRNLEHDDSFFQFLLINVFAEGSYGREFFEETGCQFVDYSQNRSYNLDLSYENFNMNISRLEEHNKLISGTFNLRYLQTNLIEGEIQDTLYITDGRFDLKGN